MSYYILGFLLLVAVFVAGFFVGKKHGQRVVRGAGALKDTVGKF